MHLNETKADRAVRERAYELAASGRFDAAREVERALIGEGWPNVGSIMHQEYVAKAVDEKCRHARETAH
ncbi:MAG: hypothetical protein R3E04_00700 [Sphingobium sp.]